MGRECVPEHQAAFNSARYRGPETALYVLDITQFGYFRSRLFEMGHLSLLSGGSCAETLNNPTRASERDRRKADVAHQNSNNRNGSSRAGHERPLTGNQLGRRQAATGDRQQPLLMRHSCYPQIDSCRTPPVAPDAIVLQSHQSMIKPVIMR